MSALRFFNLFLYQACHLKDNSRRHAKTFYTGDRNVSKGNLLVDDGNSNYKEILLKSINIPT